MSILHFSENNARILYSTVYRILLLNEFCTLRSYLTKLLVTTNHNTSAANFNMKTRKFPPPSPKKPLVLFMVNTIIRVLVLPYIEHCRAHRITSSARAIAPTARGIAPKLRLGLPLLRVGFLIFCAWDCSSIRAEFLLGREFI